MAELCTYIFKKGQRKGKNCKQLCHLNHIFCKSHIIKRSSNEPCRSVEVPLKTNKAIVPIIQVYKKIQEDAIKNKIDTICVFVTASERFSKKNTNAIISFMTKDKKNISKKINLILLKKIGSASYDFQFTKEKIRSFLMKELNK